MRIAGPIREFDEQSGLADIAAIRHRRRPECSEGIGNLPLSATRRANEETVKDSNDRSYDGIGVIESVSRDRDDGALISCFDTNSAVDRPQVHPIRLKDQA